MSNISTTNLPSGFTNAALGSVMESYGADDPSVFHTYWNDFDTFIVGSSGAADWKLTTVGTTPTAAIAAGNGGILSMVNSAASSDLDSLQLQVASFAIVAGSKSWFKVRLQVSNAANSVFTVGLIQTTTTPLTVTDGMWFSTANASTAVNFNMAKSSAVTTVSSIATLANTTYLNLGWHYNGNDKVEVFANNVKVGGTTVLTNLPTANLNMTLALSNGTAASNTMLVDYVGCSTERDPASL